MKRNPGRPIAVYCKRKGGRAIATVVLDNGRSRKYTLTRASLQRLKNMAIVLGDPRGQVWRGLPAIVWREHE